MLSKFFQLIKSHQQEIFLGSCIILISIISYNLGQINSLKKTSITVKEGSNLNADIYQAAETKTSSPNIQNTKYNIQDTKLDTRVVVSKNSDKYQSTTRTKPKYHYFWCLGAKQIKPENQIVFNSAQEAEKAGYELAKNCSL